MYSLIFHVELTWLYIYIVHVSNIIINIKELDCGGEFRKGYDLIKLIIMFIMTL